jgi:AcrR family transcriptional regulator
MRKHSAPHRILVAARRLFFEHGFEKVSTDLLAREAEVSKASIYRHFKNMPDILRCVTQAETEKFCGLSAPKIETLEDLRAALTQYGVELLNFLNAPDTMEFTRLMHEEARSNPEVGRTFFEAAYGQTQLDFAKMFALAQGARLLSDESDTMDIAEDFISLLAGLGMLRVQFGLVKVPYTDVERHTARAVATILRMHATPPSRVPEGER